MNIKNQRSGPTNRRSRREIWIVLILTCSLLLLATTVMALNGREADADPITPHNIDEFDSAQAIQSVSSALAGELGGGSVNDGCLQDVYNAYDRGQASSPGTLNCTSNDVTVAKAINLIQYDDCDFVGDTVTFDFTAVISLNAQARHDVGIYFATDGDPNGDGALTGQCLVSTPFYSGTFVSPSINPPIGSYADLDGEADDTGNTPFGYCQNGSSVLEIDDDGFPQPCNENGDCDIGGGYSCQSIAVNSYQDICGDITGAENTISNPIYYDVIGVTAVCKDDDGDGYLNLPFAASWRQPGNNDLCLSPLAAFPGAPSKCKIDSGFDVPIIVPPNLQITKTVSVAEAEPSEIFSYTLVYSNPTPSQPLTNLLISDTMKHQFTPVDISGSPGPISCTVDGFEVYPGGLGLPLNPTVNSFYDGLIQCAMPDLAVDGGGTLEIKVMVDPTATNRLHNIRNWACIEGTGNMPTSTPPSITDCDYADITTPVTVVFFKASANGKRTQFEWETATETGNAGFNIYVQTPGGLQKVNDELILSHVVDSLTPQQYSFQAVGAGGDTFFIEDVSLWDEGRLHGPFATDVKHGQRSEMELIDWAEVQIENNALATQRAAERQAVVNGQNLQANKPGPIDRLFELAGNSVTKLLGREANTAEAAVYPVVELKVKEDGIYRVSYEDVAAVAGSSLKGAPMTQLVLLNQGKLVPLYISDTGGFRPGQYFDFYGEGLDTLYTDMNVYQLLVREGVAVHAGVDNTRPQRKAQPADYYMETVKVEKNLKYSYRASNDDPWYDKVLYTRSGMSFVRNLTIDNYVAAAPSTLAVEIWGVSNRIDGDDHHVQVAVNGQPYIDELFDFQEVMDANAQLSAADINNGVNTLTFTIPNDQGADYDMAALEGYSLTYPRAFVAQDGQLDFEGTDDVFSVEGLGSRDVVVYRLSGEKLTRVNQVKLRKTGRKYSARFAGSEAGAAYFVSTTGALATPEITLAAAHENINGGSAELLLIAHPNFISGIAPLVAQRQSEGLSVKVVDVQQIFQQYSGGVFDAHAIEEYISHAIARMGTRYVLLVGGDTRDYRDYTGKNSISFVPTLYGKTSDRIHMAPVDPLFADVTGDGVPDAAIGRFPVHTVAELNAVVGKTLTYHARPDRDSAVFAADDGFETDSDSLIPSGWSIEKAYVGDDFDDARANLLAQMNAGVPVASFIGHSDTAIWTFDGLFNSADAAGLSNHGQPMVVTQWGCFNTYFVGEAYKTLGDNFLLSGSNGAAAVTGATTITRSSSEQQLGALMMPRLTSPGTRIGDAMQDAKVELNKTHPRLLDVQLGWTILGDPTLVVSE